MNLENDELTGISIVNHSETPGLGARVVEPDFTDSFKGKSLDADLTTDDINALSGATLSTKGVLAAVNSARAMLEEHKDQMVQ